MNIVHEIIPTLAQEKVNFVISIPYSDEAALSNFILRVEDILMNNQAIINLKNGLLGVRLISLPITTTLSIKMLS